MPILFCGKYSTFSPIYSKSIKLICQNNNNNNNNFDTNKNYQTDIDITKGLSSNNNQTAGFKFGVYVYFRYW